ncbi:MAG: hypothetical protein IDH49_12275, partial [Gammaproteobacteria bacterium]|nr:hypothetical protein [Gammaproteobacteria bacterium]
MADRTIPWKGPFGRQWWENNAADAWNDLGRPDANDPPADPPTQNDLEYDAFRHAYTHAIWVREFGEDMSRVAGDRVELDRNNGSSGNRVGHFARNSYSREHASENFESQIFLISDPVCPALDDA